MQATRRKPVALVTATDLAPQSLEMLNQREVVFAGEEPTEEDIVALCLQHKAAAANVLAVFDKRARTAA